jgi:hypothetical protein
MDIFKFFRKKETPEPNQFQKSILDHIDEIPPIFQNRVPPKELFYSDEEPGIDQLLPRRDYENYSAVNPTNQVNHSNQNQGKKMTQIEVRINEFDEFQNRKFFDEGYDHGGRSISFNPLENGLEALFGRARQLLSMIISISDSSIRQFQMVIEMDKENHVAKMQILEIERIKKENQEILDGLNAKKSGLYHQILQYEDGFKQGFSNRLNNQINS